MHVTESLSCTAVTQHYKPSICQLLKKNKIQCNCRGGGKVFLLVFNRIAFQDSAVTHNGDQLFSTNEHWLIINQDHNDLLKNSKSSRLPSTQAHFSITHNILKTESKQEGSKWKSVPSKDAVCPAIDYQTSLKPIWGPNVLITGITRQLTAWWVALYSPPINLCLVSKILLITWHTTAQVSSP